MHISWYSYYSLYVALVTVTHLVASLSLILFVTVMCCSLHVHVLYIPLCDNNFLECFFYTRANPQLQNSTPWWFGGFLYGPPGYSIVLMVPVVLMVPLIISILLIPLVPLILIIPMVLMVLLVLLGSHCYSGSHAWFSCICRGMTYC